MNDELCDDMRYTDTYSYHRSLAGGTIYRTRARMRYIICPRGLQPEADIFSYSTEGPEVPSAIRFFRPRGEVDMDYIHWCELFLEDIGDLTKQSSWYFKAVIKSLIVIIIINK
jgi:hypothetical protein